MSHLEDLFGRKIVPGNTFLRIEHKMGGPSLRYYFLGGFADDGRIQVQEYGGVPRTINVPGQHQSTLILLTDDLVKLAKLTPPTIDEVTAPPVKKATKGKPLEL